MTEKLNWNENSTILKISSRGYSSLIIHIRTTLNNDLNQLRRFMMINLNLNDLHPEFIIDQQGEKHSVILPISEFEELSEDLEDLAAVAERKEEATISNVNLLTELNRDGLI